MRSSCARFLLGALIPGLGHLGLGHRARGFLLFALFVSSANTAVLGGLLQLERLPLAWMGLDMRFLVLCSAAAALAFWLLTLADLYRLTWGAGGPDESQRREREFQEAQVAYLRGEWTEGERRLLALIRREPLDPALWLWLARLRRSSGRLREARAACARARRCDPEGLWSWELGQEWAALAAAG